MSCGEKGERKYTVCIKMVGEHLLLRDTRSPAVYTHCYQLCHRSVYSPASVPSENYEMERTHQGTCRVLQ